MLKQIAITTGLCENLSNIIDEYAKYTLFDKISIKYDEDGKITYSENTLTMIRGEPQDNIYISLDVRLEDRIVIVLMKYSKYDYFGNYYIDDECKEYSFFEGFGDKVIQKWIDLMLENNNYYKKLVCKFAKDILK
jgi:hypothetical protein